MSIRSLCLAPVLFLVATMGCGSSTGSVVVGVTSELRAGVDMNRLHVVMRANDEVIRDDNVSTEGGVLTFPTEFSFDDLDDGTPVEILLEAYGTATSQTPLLTRAASTDIIAYKTLLLPIRLETECVVLQGETGCSSPDTCIAGICKDPYVEPTLLKDYTPGWATVSNDICKPAGGGDPVVVVGRGQGDYLPMDDLEVAQVEAGPQGGHHIWVAIRMKNLRQSGSITSISGHVSDLNFDISPFNVIFTFDPDEGGFCKLYGLRFQLDTEIDIQQLLGKVIDVEVKVTDPDGAIGIGKRRVTLSDTII